MRSQPVVYRDILKVDTGAVYCEAIIKCKTKKKKSEKSTHSLQKLNPYELNVHWGTMRTKNPPQVKPSCNY